MRWPRLRRTRPPSEPSRADEALEQSREQLEKAREQRRRFEEFAAKVRRMREENHLAEAFDRAFREGSQ